MIERQQRTLLLLLLITTLDIMSLSVLIPSFRDLFNSHGINLTMQGWVGSVSSLVTFVMSPILGRASDKWGRVTLLRLSVLGSVLQCAGMLLASGKWSFIAARVLPGLSRCMLPVGFAYVYDISTDLTRTKNISIIGCAGAIGFILGPAIGAFFIHWGPIVSVLRFSFLLSILSFLCLLKLREPDKKRSPSRGSNGDKVSSPVAKVEHSVMDILAGEKGHLVAFHLLGRFMFIVAEFMLHSTLQVFVIQELHMKVSHAGLIVSYMGFMSGIAQFFFVGKYASQLPPLRVLLIASLVSCTAFTLFSDVQGPKALFIVLGIEVFSSVSFLLVNKTCISSTAPSDLSGTVEGMQMGSDTFARAIGGPLGGYLYGAYGPRKLALVSAMLVLCTALSIGLLRRHYGESTVSDVEKKTS